MKIGTIQEMTGQGYEILVDTQTRSYVLAEIFDGKFIECASATPCTEKSAEPTLVPDLGASLQA